MCIFQVVAEKLLIVLLRWWTILRLHQVIHVSKHVNTDQTNENRSHTLTNTTSHKPPSLSFIPFDLLSITKSIPLKLKMKMMRPHFDHNSIIKYNIQYKANIGFSENKMETSNNMKQFLYKNRHWLMLGVLCLFQTFSVECLLNWRTSKLNRYSTKLQIKKIPIKIMWNVCVCVCACVCVFIRVIREQSTIVEIIHRNPFTVVCTWKLIEHMSNAVW